MIKEIKGNKNIDGVTRVFKLIEAPIDEKKQKKLKEEKKDEKDAISCEILLLQQF